MISDHHDHPRVWSWEVLGVFPALHDLPWVWSWEHLEHLKSHALLGIGLLTSPEMVVTLVILPCLSLVLAVPSSGPTGSSSGTTGQRYYRTAVRPGP